MGIWSTVLLFLSISSTLAYVRDNVWWTTHTFLREPAMEFQPSCIVPAVMITLFVWSIV